MRLSKLVSADIEMKARWMPPSGNIYERISFMASGSPMIAFVSAEDEIDDAVDGPD